MTSKLVTKNLFDGVLVSTTKKQFYQDLEWIKSACPEYYARREHMVIQEFVKLKEKRKFKVLIEKDIMKKATKKTKVAFYN